jgi:hypothetical protein
MPEVFRRKVADGSVRQSLYEMRSEFLPTEIREDANARWVMAFDDLRQRANERQGNDRESDLWALDLVVTSTLQKQIPFYFASLFHIGRQWKVSESAAGALLKASTGENLRTSARLTVGLLDRRDTRDRANYRVDRLARLGRTPDVTTQALAFLLTSSAEEHSTRLQESRHWWTDWRQEVASLRHRVDRIQELAGREFDHRVWREITALAVEGSRPSQLRMAMETAGLTFPHQPADQTRSASIVSELLWPLLLVAASQSKFRGPFAHEFMFEMRHMLHDMKEETENGESRRTALERLRKKYAPGEDPFEFYLPLHKPASDELRNLILEHTLPGYGHQQHSPWLATWKRCVEYDPTSTITVRPKDFTTEKSANAFARSADCAIKDSLPDKFLPGEAWDDVAQRLFESAWVAKIADQIVNTSAKLGDIGWSFDSFVTMVHGVAAVLNDLGYRLVAPSETRLEKLWDRLRSDKGSSDEEW